MLDAHTIQTHNLRTVAVLKLKVIAVVVVANREGVRNLQATSFTEQLFIDLFSLCVHILARIKDRSGMITS